MHIPDGACLAAQAPHTVQRLSTGLDRGCGDKWPRRKRLHLIAIRVARMPYRHPKNGTMLVRCIIRCMTFHKPEETT